MDRSTSAPPSCDSRPLRMPTLLVAVLAAGYLVAGATIVWAYNSAVDRFGRHSFHLWKPATPLWLSPGIVLAVMTAFVRHHRWAVNFSRVLFTLSLPPAFGIFCFIPVRAVWKFAHTGFNLTFTGIVAIYIAVFGGWLVLLVVGLVQLRRQSRWLVEHSRALTGGFEVMSMRAGQ